MFILNGKTLPLDTPFTVGEGDNAIQYPANWLRLTTLEEKEAIGITEQPDPEQYDDRFYWGVDNPKDLDQLKSQWIAQIKDTANKLLQPTDWMVLRQLSRGIGMSHIYEDYRTAVIDECARVETAINAAQNIEQLIEAVSSLSWPVIE